MSRAQRIEPRLTLPETRSGWAGDGWAAAAMGGTASHLPENLSSVLGAVELIAGCIASLPAAIVLDTPDGREPLPGAGASRLLARPNPRQSWPAFVQSMVASVLLHGNAVAVIASDGRGGIAGLTPVPWPWLNLRVVQGGTGARLVFDVQHATPESRLLNLPTRLLDTDVIHIRARSDNGVVGRSVLSRAAGVVAEGLDAASVAAGWWRNGLAVSGALTTDQKLDTAQRGRLTESLGQYRGTANTGKTLVLEAGLTWTPLIMNSSDSELLASRQFSVGEVARLFCIPEPMLATGSRIPPSLTPWLASFATMALAPLIALIESEFDTILPTGQHLALDMGGLLRGDYAAVAAAQAVLVQSGIATANDARRALALPAHDDGDDLRAGAPPSYPADAPGLPSLAPKPGPGGTLPNIGTNQDDGAGD